MVVEVGEKGEEDYGGEELRDAEGEEDGAGQHVRLLMVGLGISQVGEFVVVCVIQEIVGEREVGRMRRC